MRNRVDTFLPLSETTAWALAKLAVDPQDADALGQIIGKLIGRNVSQRVITTLHEYEKKGLVEVVEATGATMIKPYALTALGREVLVADTRRLLMRIHYINEIYERLKR